jgi:hypothetical protein
VLLNNTFRSAKNKQMFVEGKKMLITNKIQNTKYNYHNNHNKIITRKFTSSSYSSNSKPPNLNPKWMYIALVCGGFLSFCKNEKNDK